MNIIEVSSVSKVFGNKKISKVAVNDMNFSVKQGDIVGLIGVNGSGKSTLIKMMCGILHPDSGEVFIDGMDVWKNRKDIIKNIGIVFGQKSQLWYHLTPQETFQFLGSVYDLDKAVVEERIDNLIKAFSIEEFADRAVRKLSLGEKMKCEIVASLIHNPKLLFLDEPTIGLDVVAKKNLLSVIADYNQQFHQTVILTTHDIADVEKLCNRVVMIHNGGLLYDGTTQELLRRFESIVTIGITLEEDLEALPLKALTQKKIDKYTHELVIDTKDISLETVFEELQEYGLVNFNKKYLSLSEIAERVFKVGTIDVD
ncbi:ABC transporter ATP-binding protein [Granulicatella seriolae]|uniref:ATP-binding cassette domain-containing protein n=1 Tax=Granulicatella seriolae TaxID=2967226 RepID=A0ABT1WPM5_9LACT|nr:ATP-binding cassette domain-containing protein [Granulicatella seriolae]